MATMLKAAASSASSASTRGAAVAAASSDAARLRLVAVNDVYELVNLPRVQTFLSQLQPSPQAVVLAGDFCSPSQLSSLDGGRGMVSTLRATGLTHVSLGNHEADLRLSTLEKRIRQLTKTGQTVFLNSNVVAGPGTKAPWWTTELSPPFGIVTTPCHRVNVALIGLLSDEAGMFRNGTFRGLQIRNVLDTYSELHQQLVVEQQTAHLLLPLTHQTLARDMQLAQHMLDVTSNDSSSSKSHGLGLILGGHEHVPHDETVPAANADTDGRYVRILKSGHDAQAVALVDLTFEFPRDDETSTTAETKDENVHQSSSAPPTASSPILTEISAQLIPMADYAPSPVVQKIVDSHMAVLRNMEHESIVNADYLLPPGVLLSSKRSRHEQTTVGGVFGKAIKEELEVDVALINGATIKGNTDYPESQISYAQLKKELPFPTKMVVIPMKRWELQEAVEYSRTQPVEDELGNRDQDVERKGFLQVDAEFDHLGFHTGSPNDELSVALPRNLLNGFCEIQPLMAIGDRLKEENQFPGPDDFIPAIDLVVRHFCKERWLEIAQDHSFSEFDRGDKGFLDRNDVRSMLEKALGHSPADFLVDDMMSAIDADENGVIDPGEFSHLLAVMEREHGLLRFDLK